MAQTHAWGGDPDRTSGYTSSSNNFVYTDGIGMPTGNTNIDGNQPIRIYGVSSDYASGTGVYTAINYQGVQTGGNYTFGSSGGTFRHMIGHSSGRLYFGRNTAAGGTTSDSVGGSWAGMLCGSLTWATVASAPTGINPVRSGRNVTVYIAGSASDGGASVTSYHVQYSADGAAWTGAQDASGGSTTFSLQAAKTYRFRVYANNEVGASSALGSGSVYIPSGGQIRVGGVWKNGLAKVRIGGVWRDAVVKVRVAGAWKDAL